MRLMVLLLIGGLLGCQSNPKRTLCETADWYELGRRAGAAGQASQVEKERNRCDGHFEASQESIYTNGHNNGLAEYCTSDNGYALGKAGSAVNKVCPRPIDEGFLNGYARGKKVRELESMNENLNRKISSVSQKLKIAKNKTNQDQNQLLSELSVLEQERLANQRRMIQIEKQIN